MLLNFSNRNTQKDSPEKLFFFLDKISNIALIKIERGEIKSVLGILGDLESFLQKLWTLKHKNPGRFLRLISAQELYQNACPIKMAGHLYEENSYDAICADNLKIQTLLESQHEMGKEIIGFSRFLSGFEKIWEHAIHYEQQEITKELFRILDAFLGRVLSDPYNDLFVESILKVYFSIFKRMLRLENKDPLNQEMKSVLQWYQKYQLNRESLKNGFDDFVYEDLLDRYCFEFIVQIISGNHTISWELFLTLLSEKTDSILKGSHIVYDFINVIDKNTTQKITDLMQNSNIISRIEELENTFTALDNLEKVRQWLQSEKEVLDQIRPCLDSNQAQHFKEIELDIEQHLFYNIKRNKILEILDAAISYGIIRSRFFVTKILFSYHLLYDTKKIWFLDYILPKNSFEFLSFLARKRKINSKYFIQESILSYENYFHKSSILLLSIFLLRKDSQVEMNDAEPMRFRVNSFNAATLNSVRWYLPTMIAMAYEMQKEKGLESFLGPIHIKKRIIPFIEKMLFLINQELVNFKIDQKLDQLKIKELEIKILTKYQKHAIMRSLFDYYNRSIDHTSEEIYPDVIRVGLNVIDDKNVLMSQGENTGIIQELDYGLKLAQIEDEFVLETIQKHAIPLSFSKFLTDPKFTEIEEDLILIMSDLSFHQFLGVKTEFSPIWLEKDSKSTIPFQAGVLILNKKEIPVIVFDHYHKEEKRMLLLPVNSLGEWHQWSPLNPGEDSRKKIGFLYMNFQAFSDNAELRKEYLDHPPAWLKESGSSFDQEQYLLDHILIHIFERFEWKPIQFTTGYSIEDIL